jgi:ribosome-associated protein
MIRKIQNSPKNHQNETITSSPHNVEELKHFILHALDDEKAENSEVIDLHGKSDIADYMIVTTGRSNRHVGAIADNLALKLKTIGIHDVSLEGLEKCDWVLVDAYDIIIHIFRQEIRELYNLEKMWKMTVPTA